MISYSRQHHAWAQCLTNQIRRNTYRGAQTGKAGRQRVHLLSLQRGKSRKYISNCMKRKQRNQRVHKQQHQKKHPEGTHTYTSSPQTDTNRVAEKKGTPTQETHAYGQDKHTQRPSALQRRHVNTQGTYTRPHRDELRKQTTIAIMTHPVAIKGTQELDRQP